MTKLADKYFAISPKDNPDKQIDSIGHLCDIRDTRYWSPSFAAAKNVFAWVTGIQYTDFNNPSEYHIVEVAVTVKTNRI